MLHLHIGTANRARRTPENVFVRFSRVRNRLIIAKNI